MGIWQPPARLHRGAGALVEDRGACLSGSMPTSSLARDAFLETGRTRSMLLAAAGAGDPPRPPGRDPLPKIRARHRGQPVSERHAGPVPRIPPLMPLWVVVA